MSDLLSVVFYEITEDFGCFRVLLTYLKLYTACVLMHCDHWSSIWLCQRFVLVLDEIDICRRHRVWIPFVTRFHYELGRNTLENVAALMESRNVAFQVCHSLSVQFGYMSLGLWSPKDLSLFNETLTSKFVLSFLQSNGIMQPYVPTGRPLCLFWAERVEVTRRVV